MAHDTSEDFGGFIVAQYAIEFCQEKLLRLSNADSIWLWEEEIHQWFPPLHDVSLAFNLVE